MDSILAFGFSDIGGGEIMVVGVIALLLFGKQLPAVTRNMGKVYAQFKRAISDASTEIRREMDSAAESVEEAARDAEKAADLNSVFKDEHKAPPAPENPPPPAPAISPAAALDAMPRNIPPPVKIPPPLS